MADVAEGVRSYLLADSDVTNLIGQRMYTDQPPQAAELPYVEMEKLFTTHDHTLSNLAGIAHSRIQFRAHSLRRSTSNEIAEAIRASGIVGQKGTTGGVDIRGVRVEEGMAYSYIASRDGSDEHRYVTAIDLTIDYSETI